MLLFREKGREGWRLMIDRRALAFRKEWSLINGRKSSGKANRHC